MSSSEPSSSDSDSVPQSRGRRLSAKTKKKSKVAQPTVVATPHDKNEGTNPDWAYKPPEGAKLLDAPEDTDDFDWDALEDDEDIELWIMRVPEGVRSHPQFMNSGATSQYA